MVGGKVRTEVKVRTSKGLVTESKIIPLPKPQPKTTKKASTSKKVTAKPTVVKAAPTSSPAARAPTPVAKTTVQNQIIKASPVAAASVLPKVATVASGVSLGVDLLQGAQNLLGGVKQVSTMARDLLPATGAQDITPGIPARDLQVVDPDNIIINNATGRPAKLVPVGAKIVRRRKFRRGGMSASKVMEIVREAQQQSQMQTMMMMMSMRH